LPASRLRQRGCWHHASASILRAASSAKTTTVPFSEAPDLHLAARGGRAARVRGRARRGCTSCAGSTTRSRAPVRFEASARGRDRWAGFIGCEVAATARARGPRGHADRGGADSRWVGPRGEPLCGACVLAAACTLHRAHVVDRFTTRKHGVAFHSTRTHDAVERRGRSTERSRDGRRPRGACAIPNPTGSRVPGYYSSRAYGAIRRSRRSALRGSSVPGTSPLGLTHSPDGETRSESSTGRSPPSREAPGRNLLAENGEPQPFRRRPYFWSDQYDAKIQSVGTSGARGSSYTFSSASPDGAGSWPSEARRPGRCRGRFNAPARMPFYRREARSGGARSRVALAGRRGRCSLAAGAPPDGEDARTPPAGDGGSRSLTTTGA